MRLKLKETAAFLEAFPLRFKRKSRLYLQGHVRCLDLALSLVEGKTGLEIGGPTELFQGWRPLIRSYGLLKPLPIYDRVGALDNCCFSSKTFWAAHQDTYHFSPQRPPGAMIIADGSVLPAIADNSYDFVLSSHNLEHFANPVKALKEWKRITRPGGGLIVVLPHHQKTFDRRRAPTAVDHMFSDYLRDVGEDDSTHVEEVLHLHDLAMDGTLHTHGMEELRARTIDNFNNRMLHHHVFDESNSAELLVRAGLEVMASEFALPYHIVIIARWKAQPKSALPSCLYRSYTTVDESSACAATQQDCKARSAVLPL